MIDININNVSKSFGFEKVLNNINLTIKCGEKVALIGANGSGKSTLLKIVGGLENIDCGNVSIRKNASIGILSQVPSDINIKVKDYIYDTFSNLIILKEKLDELSNNLSSDIKIINKYTKLLDEFSSKGGYEFETKIEKVLSVFNITDEMLNRQYNTLSGGEKTLCSLIRLILIEPDILLLDEPTNHLDIKMMNWLEKYLKNYKGTVLLVSHDRYFIDKVVDKVILLTKRGIDEYLGNYSYYVEESENRLTLEFKKYKDQQKIINAMEKSIKRLQEYGRLCGDSGGEIFYRRAASIKKRLEKLEKIDKPEDKKTINIDFNGQDRTGKEVLTINDLSFSFKDKVLFDNVNLEVFYKEKICIMGSNGTGKSTLINLILNNYESVKLGTNIKLGLIPQEITFKDNNISIIEEARKYFMGEEQYLRSALFKFLFVGDNIYKKLKYLSGGEKVRLKLFCLMQDKYNFLILDEPTNHIDIDTREILENALINYSGTILFISHDRYFINKVANHIVELNNKKLNKYIGNYDNYKKD